jgi:hypothetical protein
MGGRVDCKKVPRAFTAWNETRLIVDTCEAVIIHRFKQKPTHELVKMQREKDEDDERKRRKIIDEVYKVCEYGDDLYRFFEAVHWEKITKDMPVWLRKVKKENFHKKIMESIILVAKDFEEAKAKRKKFEERKWYDKKM